MRVWRCTCHDGGALAWVGAEETRRPILSRGARPCFGKQKTENPSFDHASVYYILLYCKLLRAREKAGILLLLKENHEIDYLVFLLHMAGTDLNRSGVALEPDDLPHQLLVPYSHELVHSSSGHALGNNHCIRPSVKSNARDGEAMYKKGTSAYECMERI